MSPPPTSAAPGAAPMALARRSLAPDLARGFMLLVIATVHAHMFRQLATGGGETFALTGTLDTAVTAFMLMFAESRGYPMFAALFGYGLAQIFLRRGAEGHDAAWVRSLVRRRGRWLMVIGFLHTLLLFYGDIISVYGLIALVFAGLLWASDRRLLAHGFAWMSVGSLIYPAAMTAVLSGDMQQSAPAEVTPLIDMVMRLGAWPVMLLLMGLVSVFPFTVGVWAGRRRMLEEPERHLALLHRVALVGIPVAALGGVPQALVAVQVWPSDFPLAFGAGWLHLVSGYAGGFGYAALIALIAVRIGDRRGPVVQALAATGQRSMTCYLLQSVAWGVLFMPYTLDLARGLSDAAAVLVGVAVWLVTVVLADLMRRVGLRGPAEAFLRRRTYGRPQRTADTAVR
ncbi:putative membrane protein YeiB [Nocardiopsis sp. Huas11]|uniref:DUF418 domain-containing protein n=1 Tax=Nocardiopsis sp. Huas11 TaxID=2183912 RepID=UPI000F13C91C|nr:DUF418 domain-containing protein [Nocardiopsis sp. Huas11]RKS05097.1 putative membrane protein YeiB [Nocardiopsis sp. Huas11]